MSLTEEHSATLPAYGGHPFSWRFTTPLFLGSALNPVNSSLIATALVPIASNLGIQIGQTAALVAALYLASTTAQPTAGKAAEVFPGDLPPGARSCTMPDLHGRCRGHGGATAVGETRSRGSRAHFVAVTTPSGEERP